MSNEDPLGILGENDPLGLVGHSDYSPVKEVGKALGGTLAGTADWAAFMNPYGLATQGVPGIAGLARGAGSLLSGDSQEEALKKAISQIHATSQWTTPSELLKKAAKLAGAEEYVDNWALKATQKPGELVGEASRGIAEALPGTPGTRALTDTAAQGLLYALGFVGASKFAGSGKGTLSKETQQARGTYPSKEELAREEAVKEAARSEEFKGAQQGAFDDLIPTKIRSPYGDMSNLQVDENGMPYNPELSKPFEGVGQPEDVRQMLERRAGPTQGEPLLTTTRLQSLDERGKPGSVSLMDTPRYERSQIPDQGELFPEQKGPGIQLKQPIPGEPGTKPNPYEEPLSGVPAAQVVQTQPWHGQQLAFERAVKPTLEEPPAKTDIVTGAPGLPPVENQRIGKPTYIPYKRVADWLDTKPIGQSRFGRGQRGSIGFEKPKPIDEGHILGEEETRQMQEKLDKEAIDSLEGKKLNPTARAASRQADTNNVARFLKGDGSALQVLYEKYGPKLENVLSRKLGDTDRAKDLVQETFISAAKGLQNFRGDSALGTWLYAIADGKYKDFIKHENRHGNIHGQSEITPEMEETLRRNIDNPEEALVAKQMREHLDNAFEALSEEHKQVVNLVLFEQQSYKDAARLLDIPIGTIMSRLSRAQEAIRESVKSQERGQRNPFSGLGKKQAGAIVISNFKRDTKSKGPARAAFDALKQWSVERRPLDQIVKEERITPDSLKDLGDLKDQSIMGRIGNLQKVAASNLLIDKSMSILTESKGSIGKIAKWAVDGRREISRDAGNAIRDKVNTAFESWNKVVKSKGNLGSVSGVLGKMQENIRGRELAREDFKTDHEYNVFKELSTVLEQTRQEVNNIRAKYKLSQIDKISNYLPTILQGDYLVTVRDSSGKVVRVDSAWSVGKANRKAEAYGKLYDDTHTVEMNPKGKDINNIKNLSAFDDMIRNMSEEDPLRAVAQRTKVEIMSRRSFGRHSMQREGTALGVGWENEPRSAKEMRKVIEQYITQAENYKSNIKIKELQEQFEKLGPQFHDRIPMFTKWVRDYFDISRGASMDRIPWVKDVADQLSILLGRGENGSIHAVQNVSAVMMMFYNMRPAFFMQNFPQALNSMAKVVDLHQTMPGVKNGPAAVMEGLNNIFAREETAVRLSKWADKKGYLDSSWVAMMHLSLNDMHESRLGILGDITNWSIGKNEHHVVREPSLFIFEAALRDAVPNETKRFEMAAELMDYYMVSSDRKGAPMVYNKAGPIFGGSARPLKSFSHNTYGQFFEFLQTAREQSRFAPLGTYLGTQAMMSGLKGVMLFADATAIVYAMNLLLGTQITTPDELLYGFAGSMKDKFKGSKVVGNGMDVLVYGGYSTLIQQDISSSLNAPQAAQMMSFPVFSFTKTAVVDIGTWLVNKIKGTNTDADDMKAWLAVTPKAVHGAVEEGLPFIGGGYDKPGQPMPRPSDQMKGNYVRTPTERMVAQLLSTHSVDESTINALSRFARNTLAQDAKQKKTALERMTDDISNGKPIEGKDVQQYVMEGGKVSNLPNLLRQGVIARQLPFADRSIRGNVTPALAHKAQVEQNLLKEQQRQREQRR